MGRFNYKRGGEMNQKSVRLPLFFAIFLVLGKLAAMQEPKVTSAEDFEQKLAPQEWSLDDIRKRPKEKIFNFLDNRFMFESVKIIKIDDQHRRIVCLATIDAKRYIVSLISKKVESSLWAHWNVYSIVGDFEKDETFSNPAYNLDSGELWFKPKLDHNTSFLPQLFCVFVGRYLICQEGIGILVQKCCSCEKKIVCRNNTELVILPHYRLSGGDTWCEECGRSILVKTPVDTIHVDSLILRLEDAACGPYQTYNRI
jgi:hypothetical protein